MWRLASFFFLLCVAVRARDYYGGWHGYPRPDRDDEKDYSERCEDQISLPDRGGAVNLQNPLYPENTPARQGLHCNWKISAPRGGHGVINVQFMEIDTDDGKFNITAGDNTWRFSGSKGYVSLVSNFRTIRVKYDCSPRQYSRKFKIRVTWQPIAQNENQTNSCENGTHSCDVTSGIGLICYDLSERCNDLAICPDSSDEQHCRDCIPGPDVDLQDYEEGHMLLIGSPGWPGQYPNNATCVWKIVAQPGFVVLVRIIHLQLEFPYDYLQIGNSHDHTSWKWGIVQISGVSKYHSVISSHHEMHLKFVSDDTVRDEGFVVGVAPVNHSRITAPCNDNEFGCVEGSGVCIDVSGVCDGVQDCINAADEYQCETVNCDGYLCNSQNYLNFTPCVPMTNTCNRIQDCPAGDDELLCHILGCPDGCVCTYTNEKTRDLHVKCYHGWDADSVKKASKTSHIIELGGSSIQTLPQGIFKLHTDLRSLALIGNNIEIVRQGAFAGLGSLQWLDLSDNPIRVLGPNMFRELVKLQGLVLSNVPIQEIYGFAFIGLRYLKTLVIVTNSSLPVEVRYAGFAGLSELTKFYVDNHRLCCNFEDGGRAECISIEPTPPLFVCGSITQTTVLRLAVWFIGFGALFGNLIVLIWRTKRVLFGKGGGDDPLRVQAFLIWNLAIADFMMGIYMVILGIADTYYGEDYYIYSNVWRSSFYCKFAGFISLVSSESSVFFIVLISVDQFIKVTCASTGKRITMPVAVFMGLSLWGFSIMIGLVAILSASPDSDVYELTDVCIGLPLVKRPSDFSLMEGDVDNPLGNRTLSVKVAGGTKPAWYFSIAIFLGLNLLCFLIITVCYSIIFGKLRQMTKAAMKVQGEVIDMVVAPKDTEPSHDAVDNVYDDNLKADPKENGLEYTKSQLSLSENGHEDTGIVQKPENVEEATEPEINTKESNGLEHVYETIDEEKAKIDEAHTDEPTNDIKESHDDQGDNKEKGIDNGHDGKDGNPGLPQHDLNDTKYDNDEEDKDQEMAEEVVQETRSHVDESEMETNEEQVSKMARKMGMIVVTDFLCWMPVIIMGILAQCGFPIPTVMFVWSVVLILPINSSVNPYLYTFSTCKMASYGDDELGSLTSNELHDRETEAERIRRLVAQI